MGRVTGIDDAMALIRPAARVIVGPGCGEPTTLLTALAERSHEVAGIRLHAGILLETPTFLDAVAAGRLAFTTWHVTGPLREAVADGSVDFLPLRASEVGSVLGPLGIDVAFLRVTPPDSSARVSLGPSAGYTRAAALHADVVIGEVDPALPWTHGDSVLPVECFSELVETEHTARRYAMRPPDDAVRRIARTILDLLPDAASLQLGIGAVPEAVIAALTESGTAPAVFVGMGSDGMVDMAEQGLLDGPGERVAAVELMGTERLMAFADRNPTLGVYPSEKIHDPAVQARRPRFVSINSAVEVDLWGQVNGETIGGAQAAAVGGSMDFFEAGRGSAGGLRIIALPATTRHGRSRIVARLAGVVSIPRHSVDVVVTEFGAARLSGRTLRERAEALVGVAHPDHRDALADAL